jgi:hypothetical protein
MDALQNEILFVYSAINLAAHQETMREAGIEPGTAALQSVLNQLSHNIPAIVIATHRYHALS